MLCVWMCCERVSPPASVGGSVDMKEVVVEEVSNKESASNAHSCETGDPLFYHLHQRFSFHIHL